jgi:hypothetical protein
MNSLIKRRLRLVRLRDIEHKQAVARLIQAERTQHHLMSMDARIGSLKGSFIQYSGLSNGQELAAIHEMSARLDAASARLTTPIIQAGDESRAHEHDVKGAHRNVIAATQLHDGAVASAERDADTRDQRNFVFRSNNTTKKARA